MRMVSAEALSLLSELVEAARKQPRDQRQPFYMMPVVHTHNYQIIHPGFGADHSGAYPGDVDLLVRAGLLLARRENNHFVIDITPAGFEEYAAQHKAASSPVAAVEAEMRALLDSAAFRQLHRGSFGKWSEAANLLWNADGTAQLTTIGHLCREAMQAFAAELIARFNPSNPPADPTKTVDRIRSVLQAKLSSSAKSAFLDALLNYWGTVNDLVQRQEHGGLKEGEALVWDDGRRVVFQTMNVMYEISHHLNAIN